MGPGNIRPSLPSRPKFSSYIKAVTWMESMGDKLMFDKYVKMWGQFYDNLVNSNGNNIKKKDRRPVLPSHLYGRLADFLELFENQVEYAEDGTDLIADEVYQRDKLSVVSLVYTELQKLIYNRRESYGSFSSFESRLSAKFA